MDGPLPPDLAEAWESFFAAGRHLELDADGLCPAVFSHPLLFPLQRKRETAAMLARARDAETVCEIGADKGGGLLHWCMLPRVRRVIACEVRGTPYAEQFEAAFPDASFLWLPRSSYDPATVVKAETWLGRHRIDGLFLDGDKANFDRDFTTYLPLMSPRGLVFFHDVNEDRPMRRAFERSARKAGRRSEVIIDTSEAEEELARPEPTPTAHAGWLRHWKGASCGVGVVYLGEPT